MFQLTKEGDPGWTEPSDKEKLRRRVRWALELNPFVGAAQTESIMSAVVFMKRMGTFDQLMKDTIEFLQSREQ